MVRLRSFAFVWLLAGALPGRAAAQAPAPVFQLEGALPFTAAELQAAAELRVPGWPGVGAQPLIVRGRDGGEVELELRGWRRGVALGAATGAEAARLVALALGDLMLAIASQPAPAVVPGTNAGDAERPPRAAVEAPPARALGFTRMALGPSAGRGLGVLEPWSYGLGLSVTRAFRPWLFDAELGFALAPQRGRVALTTSWTAARLRVHAGVRIAELIELLAGPALIPFWVSGGDGFFGVMPALGVSVRAVARLGPALDAVLAAGSDLFLRRVELQAFGVSVIATPRFAPWVGLALGWRSP